MPHPFVDGFCAKLLSYGPILKICRMKYLLISIILMYLDYLGFDARTSTTLVQFCCINLQCCLFIYLSAYSHTCTVTHLLTESILKSSRSTDPSQQSLKFLKALQGVPKERERLQRERLQRCGDARPKVHRVQIDDETHQVLMFIKKTMGLGKLPALLEFLASGNALIAMKDLTSQLDAKQLISTRSKEEFNALSRRKQGILNAAIIEAGQSFADLMLSTGSSARISIRRYILKKLPHQRQSVPLWMITRKDVPPSECAIAEMFWVITVTLASSLIWLMHRTVESSGAVIRL